MRTLFYFTFAVLVVGAPCRSSAADVFKCMTDGRTTYQSSPCDGATAVAPIQSQRQSTLIGCYAAAVTGLESGFEVRRAQSSEYVLQIVDGPNKQSLPLKIATADELKQVSAGFGLKASDGLSVKWPPGTPNQKPIGLYRTQEPGGKEMLLAFFFLANGIATKVPCK